MTNSLKLLVASAALVVLPASLQAAGDSTCSTAKACCATTTATSTTAKESGTCCASAKGNYVMLKLKGGDAGGISQTLSKLDGVSAADTCSESKFTKISFNQEKVCSSKIMTALKDAGYKVQTQRVTYAVEGLACGACTTKVTKALSKLKGVSETHVCSESKQAVIDFNPSKVTVEKILATLDATGFKASEVVN
jgi:copper ion binding protein